VGIEIQHSTETERLHFYNHFVALKKMLEQTTGEWQWHAAVVDENGQTISRICQVLNNASVLNEADWPAIIAFLKPRITALDAFWETVKDGFE
jgi:glutamate racemase